MNSLLLKKYYIVGFLIGLLLMTSCGNAEIRSVSEDTVSVSRSSDNPEYHTISKDNSAIFDTDAGKLQATQEKNEEIPDYPSISEMFKACDSRWNDSTEYLDAVQSYEAALGQDAVELLMEEAGGVVSPHFSFGYVDDDDIPELFMGLGDYHVTGIYVFTYIPNQKEVVRVGQFSEFGRLEYIEKGNRIISQYGGMGSFIFFYTQIIDGKPMLVGSVAQTTRKKDDSEPTGEALDKYEDKYYADYPMPEGVDGSYDCEIDWDWPDDSYCVSFNEYERATSVLQGDMDHPEEKRISVSYESMPVVGLTEGGVNFLVEHNETNPKLGEDILNNAFPERVDAWRAYRRIVEVALDDAYSENKEAVGYDLFDINGDGTNELMIFDGIDHLDKVQIYSYINHKAVYLGSFGERGSVEIDPTSHIICSKFTGLGSIYERYYEVKGGNVVKLMELADIEKPGTEESPKERKYVVNGVLSTKDVYESKRAKYSNKLYEIFNIDHIRVNNQWLEGY